MTSVLRGALAASVTPLRDHGTAVDDDAFGPLADFFVDAGLDGILALGYSRRGDPPPRRGASSRCRSLPAGVGSTAPDRSALRRADHRGHRGARGPRCRGRRGRRRGHRPAVLQARRERPSTRTSSPPRWRAHRCRSTCTSSRRRPAMRSLRPCSSAFATTWRTSSASRCRTRPGSGSGEYVLARLRHLRRPRVADRDGMAHGAPSARSRPSRRHFRVRSRRSSASRPPRGQPGSASFAPSSSAFRVRPRSSASSRFRAFP